MLITSFQSASNLYQAPSSPCHCQLLSGDQVPVEFLKRTLPNSTLSHRPPLSCHMLSVVFIHAVGTAADDEVIDEEDDDITEEEDIDDVDEDEDIMEEDDDDI